jgi:iron(III) transport system ATP-binding protein
MNPAILELNNISQAYGRNWVVKNLTLSLEKGQIGCLLGASGCGKTTVLRTIAGFEPLLRGEIVLNGVTVSREDLTIPPARRAIGMVFQDYALFPHLTLFDNVAFGLRGLERRERIVRVGEMLELVGLDRSHDKYPHEISGGQQQRVALARALAPRPALLLLDEPFSNLDVTLRERLSTEVRDILKAYGATALFVTHNQNEAFAVADRIGVMADGAMLQWDDAHALYHCPSDRRVAAFVGEGMFLPGIVEDSGMIDPRSFCTPTSPCLNATECTAALKSKSNSQPLQRSGRPPVGRITPSARIRRRHGFRAPRSAGSTISDWSSAHAGQQSRILNSPHGDAVA